MLLPLILSELVNLLTDKVFSTDPIEVMHGDLLSKPGDFQDVIDVDSLNEELLFAPWPYN